MTIDVEDGSRADAAHLPPATSEDAPDDGVTVFTSQRPRLRKIASRVLGDTAEAEDVVQEVWLRWQRTNRDEIDNPPAFLATATTRVAINVLQSAHRRRETSITPRSDDLTEVVMADADPASDAERAEAAEQALRVMLERLSPAERAAYLLRKAFDYPYGRIADLVPCTAANARQLVRRAHLRLASSPCQPVSSLAHRRLVSAFVAAAQVGDFAELEALLVADIGRGST
jgi:RNA polymerase sigma factor (sigma-70 family)